MEGFCRIRERSGEHGLPGGSIKILGSGKGLQHPKGHCKNSMADDNSSGKKKKTGRKLHKAQFRNGKDISYRVAREKKNPLPQGAPGQESNQPY